MSLDILSCVWVLWIISPRLRSMIPQTTLRKPHRPSTSIKCRPIQGPWSQLYNPPLTGHLGHRTTNPPNQSIRPAANRLHEWPIQITAHLLQKLHWSQHWPSLLPSWPENIIDLWNFHWCLHLPYANPIRTGKILLSSFFNWWNPNFSLKTGKILLSKVQRLSLKTYDEYCSGQNLRWNYTSA